MTAELPTPSRATVPCRRSPTTPPRCWRCWHTPTSRRRSDHPPLRPRDPRHHRRSAAHRGRRRRAGRRRGAGRALGHDGIAIGIGVNPWYGVLDPERMAHAVVDEAIRNVVAVGADPDMVVAARQLLVGRPAAPDHARRSGGGGAGVLRGVRCAPGTVRQRQGLAQQRVPRQRRPTPQRAAHAGHHRRRPRARRRRGRHPRPQASRQRAGARRHHRGRVRRQPPAAHCSAASTIRSTARCPAPDPAAPARYRRLHAALRTGRVRACHDLSEGGLAVALAEMAIGGGLGIDVQLAATRRSRPCRCSPRAPAGSSASWPRPTSTGSPPSSANRVHVLGMVTAEPIVDLLHGTRHAVRCGRWRSTARPVAAGR